MTTIIESGPQTQTPEFSSADDAGTGSAPLSAARLARWLFAMFVGIFTVRTAIDPDLFWHLRTGEWIVNNGIPRSDVFSFTVPDNSWVTHEWLTQVLGWGAYSVGGFAGVSVLFAIVGGVAAWFTYRTVDGGPLQKVVLTMGAMFVASVAYGARPQLVTLAFAAGFVWLVEKVRAGELSPTKLWWAVPATVVWANLHSGFLLGVVILATYAIGDALQRRFLGDTGDLLAPATTRRLAEVAGVSFLAAAMNPSGPRLWIYPFETLRSEQMRSLIAEWHSPDFQAATFRPFLVLILVAFVVLAASKRRPTVTEMLLVGGTVAAGLTSLRHVALAAVVTMPVLARHLSSAVAETRLGPWLSGERDRDFSVGPIFAALVAAVLALVVGVRAVGTFATNDATTAELYPVAAVDYLYDADLAGEHGYNAYGWGGYLIWRDIEVFSDGRADVYGEEFLTTVSELNDTTTEWEELFGRFGIEWALIRVEDPLRTVMIADSDWVVAYEDEISAVMVRSD